GGAAPRAHATRRRAARTCRPRAPQGRTSVRAFRRRTAADRSRGVARRSSAAVPRRRADRRARRGERRTRVRDDRRAGASRALHPVTAEFRAGTVTAVTGPSGSGKTTLLHLLAGLELPTDGTIDVLGTSIATLDRARRAAVRRSHIGYVGQQPGLISTLSAVENVELALALRRRDPDGAREALVAVGLEER